MRVFAKKGIIQKTIIAIVMVLCINFIIPTYSNAGIGGILLSPFVDFFCTIGDACINVMQRLMTGEWGSEGGMNFSLNAFLMESNQYYDEHDVDGYDKDEVAYITINPDSTEEGKKFTKGWLWNSGEYYVPVATYSPEQIFAGQVSGLDINFINPNFEDGSADILQETIAKWYVALRNLCVVGLLCVLVYVGIRIMLSSTAPDKAKYKQMFTDWLIALCILFFLHYIMSFVLTMTESVCNAIGGDGKNTVIVYDEAAGQEFQTNLLGLARFQVQYEDAGQKLTYCILYLALVVYTAIFTWHYLKRLLMMAFLTIIAPMVALTYPIDKIGDGKAQAFNMWLKEYIFNALIQPFHLIIYTVFVGSAIDLAAKNMLYAIACMAFILPAEKILKKMFGFDRAPLGTMGALTGFTAGSLASKFLGGKGGSGSKAISGGNDASGSKPPRYEKKHGTDGIDYSRSNIKQADNPELPQGEKENKNETVSESARRAIEEQQKAQEEQQKAQEELARRAQLEEQEQDLQAQQNQIRQHQEELKDEQDKGDIRELPKSRGKIRTGINNIVSANGGGKRIALKGAKTLGKAAKFAVKSGFAIAGTAAGIGAGLASGQGFAGAVAGATAGKKLGTRMGEATANLPGNVIARGNRMAAATRSTIDTFNGNKELEDKAQAKAFMKDESTEQYVRDKLTKDNNGTAPTGKAVKEEMKSIQKYANEGMTDIAQIYRAKKAEEFGVSAEQSAKIALLAQDRKITSDVLGDEKKYNARKQDFTQEFINKGQSEADAARNADYILNVMKAQVGQQHNLKKVSKARPSQQIEAVNKSNEKIRTRNENLNKNNTLSSGNNMKKPRTNKGK